MCLMSVYPGAGRREGQPAYCVTAAISRLVFPSGLGMHVLELVV